jgi:hypothetical protein
MGLCLVRNSESSRVRHSRIFLAGIQANSDWTLDYYISGAHGLKKGAQSAPYENSFEKNCAGLEQTTTHKTVNTAN